MTISGNRGDITIQLTKKAIRKELGQMSVFDFEKLMNEKLAVYTQK